MSNSKLKIFVCAHKKFENKCFKDPMYRILYSNELRNFDENILEFDRTLSEGSQMYCIWKNPELTEGLDYIGLAQYRRHLVLPEDFDVEKEFKKVDLILPEPLRRNERSIYGYFKSECNEMLYINMLATIKTIYPDFYEDALSFSNGFNLAVSDIFIMRKEDYMNMCEFCFNVIGILCAKYNFKNDGDILKWTIEHKDEIGNIKNKEAYHIPDYFSSYEYCSRIPGFILERLTNIYYYHKLDKIKVYKLVEEKYDWQKKSK